MRAAPYVALALAAAWVLGPALLAAAGPEPTTIGTAYNTQRKLARGADGTLYAAVTTNASGVGRVRVLETRDGTSWDALPDPSATATATDRVALAADSTGRLHLVWTELEVQGGQVFHASYASRAWSAPEQLSFSPGYAGYPSIAVDAQDRVHVVWYGFDGLHYQVYYDRFDGANWTGQQELTRESVDATNPALALGPDGFAHVAWFRQVRNATSTEIAYLRLEGGTTPVELRTISAPGVSADNPSLLVEGDGTVHLVWTGFVGGAGEIQYRERWTNGTWSDVAAVSPPGVGAEHPSLTSFRGGLRVAWEGADGAIYYQSRLDGAWSAPRALTSSGTNRYPTTRWSQFADPCRDQVDVVWTHEEGGVRSLGYASPEGAGSCFPPAEWPWVLGLVAAIAVVALVVLFVVVRRRRRPRTVRLTRTRPR